MESNAINDEVFMVAIFNGIRCLHSAISSLVLVLVLKEILLFLIHGTAKGQAKGHVVCTLIIRLPLQPST